MCFLKETKKKLHSVRPIKLRNEGLHHSNKITKIKHTPPSLSPISPISPSRVPKPPCYNKQKTSIMCRSREETEQEHGKDIIYNSIGL